MTTAKFHSQFVMVDMALAFVRIALGFISAGSSQGNSSHVLEYILKDHASLKIAEHRTIQRP